MSLNSFFVFFPYKNLNKRKAAYYYLVLDVVRGYPLYNEARVKSANRFAVKLHGLYCTWKEKGVSEVDAENGYESTRKKRFILISFQRSG